MRIRALADILEVDRSKQRISELILQLEKEGFAFGEFFEVLPTIKLPVRWYLCWMLTHYVERNPDHGTTHQNLIWETLKACNNDSMRRDLWRTLTFIQISEDLSGEIYDKALSTITSQNYPIAVRAHAMYVAGNIAKPYPELRNELLLILKDFDQEESAGIRSRARNLRKALKN